MKKVLSIFIVFSAIINAQSLIAKIDSLIDIGKFNEANAIIEEQENACDAFTKYELGFRKDLMDRIKIDFNKSEAEVKGYIRQYIPDFTEKDFIAWKKNRQIEFFNINGNDKYFHSAARNFFRINREASKIFAKVNKLTKDGLDKFLESYIPNTMEEIDSSKSTLTNSKKIKLHYKLSIPANTIPANEVIRCWLPYPKEIPNRQFEVNLLNVNSDNYIIAPNNYPHRSIYLEKISKADEETIFEITFEYKSNDIKFKYAELKNYGITEIPGSIKKYIVEEPPHIIFTEELKQLSERILGKEINKLSKARLIYKWINDSIPWASAREYSTIKNIPLYCVENRHGDCGIQSLLFITLCRLNGIPAKWQSGWMLHPNEVNLHDWAEIYITDLGWVPVDQSFGLQDLPDEEQKWFFFGGLDRFHLIINDDISKKFYPAKIYPRSETVDFQRGEVEWRGGNLYFDKWDYHMEVVYE